MPSGPTIGQMPGTLHRKNHASYRPGARRAVLTVRRQMPGGSGFLWLEAKALYTPALHQLSVTISSRRREGNPAPGIFLQRVYEDWNQLKNQDGSVPTLLHAVLAEVAAEVAAGTYPQRDCFLAQCNVTGREVGEFVEQVCTSCLCWYCTLSPAAR